MLSEEKIDQILFQVDIAFCANKPPTESKERMLVRAIEAAVLAERAKAEPVARSDWNEGRFEWLTKYRYELHHMRPLYLHPAPAPEGMVLVPREPTEEMYLAGAEIKGSEYTSVRSIYRAMIAAAEKESKS